MLCNNHKKSDLNESDVSETIPILFEEKKDCCGCAACYSICPCNAISMIEDEEGFDYPFIDAKSCLRCGLCIKVCPLK